MDEDSQTPSSVSRRPPIIAAAVVIVVAAAAYFWYSSQKEAPASTENQPAVETPTELPSANPLQKTNPLEGAYQNPFE